MKTIDERRNTSELKFSSGNSCCSTIKKLGPHSSVHTRNKSPNIISVISRKILSHELLLWILFFYIEYNTGESSKPLNRAAIRGEKVQLNCSTKDALNGYWKFARPLQREEIIYDVDNVVNGFKSLYTVDDSVRGHFNLLFNASESTSGTYVCQPDVITADQSAEVIALDAPPNCSHAVTSDFVNATCIINFSGNWMPAIEWRILNGKLDANYTSTISNSRGRVISSLSASLSQTDPGAQYILSCTPKFTIEGKPKATTATNVPEFPYNCTLIIESSTIAPSTQPNSSSSPSSPPSPPLYIIGICISVIACVAATVFAVMLWKRGKCGKTRKTKDQSEALAMTKKL